MNEDIGSAIPSIEQYGPSWYCIPKAKCRIATAKAILVYVPTQIQNGQWWLPKSQLCPETNEVWEPEHVGIVVFSAWIARAKGWLAKPVEQYKPRLAEQCGSEIIGNTQRRIVLDDE